MSASEAPRAKRPRPADDDETAATRSDIWYHDGSVVLSAKNTLLFKVHWSVLSQHSSVFRDMAGIPQPPSDSVPSVDGCPVVELHDDPVDVANLLRALYDPTLLSQQTLPFPLVAALIRLGRKYSFESMWESCVDRVAKEFPTTLAEFDARARLEHFKFKRITPQPGLDIDLLTLLEENDILTPLPCLYWYICLMPKEQWTNGEPRGDGTTAHLSPTALARCIQGSERMSKKQYSQGYALSWLVKPPRHTCMDYGFCVEARLEVLRKRLTASGSNIHFLPNLEVWERKWDVFCGSCKEDIEDVMRAGRQIAWNELPSVFGLARWEELKNEI